MQKFTIKAGLILASLGMMMLSAEVLANPCRNIAEACMSEGYVKGGQAPKRLILDCVQPVVEGHKTVSYVPSDMEKEQCKMMIAKKMSEKSF